MCMPACWLCSPYYTLTFFDKIILVEKKKDFSKNDKHFLNYTKKLIREDNCDGASVCVHV
jgi:hypothetical protein